MDGRHEVLSFANDGQLFGILFPCALKVVIEDGLAETVQDTSRDDVSLDALLLEVKDTIFDFLDLGVLAASATLQVVFLAKGMVQEAFLLASGDRGSDLL